MKAGIIICSRIHSSRIPYKPLVRVNGVPLLAHLLHRLRPAELPIIVAVPPADFSKYEGEFGLLPFMQFYSGHPESPLHRMAAAAAHHGFDAIVRVTHDKIFVEPGVIRHALDLFEKGGHDYLFSSSMVPGTGFEIISRRTLFEAARRFRNVEHISYAARAAALKAPFDMEMGQRNSPHRLLIDYPNDLTVLGFILSDLGNNCSLDAVLNYLDKRPSISQINQLPGLTVYTCAYNAEKWIEFAMESVEKQRFLGRGGLEYLLIDDGSTDNTPEIMRQFRMKHPYWVKFIPLETNVGLASASNIALEKALGKYIMRLDADDYLLIHSLQDLYDAIEKAGVDALYPAHYKGPLERKMSKTVHLIQGKESHHVGGAIFSTRAMNHMKFTDGLRGYEGYDFFARAKEQLKIGYYPEPTFYYSQHEGSLSKQDPEMRARIKKEIEERVNG